MLCVCVCVHATSFFLLNVFEWVNVADELEYKKRNKISQKKKNSLNNSSIPNMNELKMKNAKKNRGLFLLLSCSLIVEGHHHHIQQTSQMKRNEVVLQKKIETFTTTTKKNLTFNITSISCWYLSWSRRPPPLTKAGETQTHSNLYIFRFFLFR